jgi:MoaA/NifB/PqqE/SkfB family radical SAM enzyme
MLKISQIVIELLTKCNFSCPYCRDVSGKKKALTVGEVKGIVAAFKKLGIDKVQLDGGEPFLYKDIFDLIEYIVEKDMGLGIYTNASMITTDVAAFIARYPEIKICVTIHPLNPGKQLTATLTGIKNLYWYGVCPQLVYVVNGLSYIKLHDTLKLLPDGAYTLVLNPIVQSGRAFDNGILPLNARQMEEYGNLVTSAREIYKNIDIIDNVTVKAENVKIEKIQMNADEEFALHINTDGFVLPFFSADNSTAIGNINNMKALEEKLSSPETLEYLELSKTAMKKRIGGSQNSSGRKICREEIIGV